MSTPALPFHKAILVVISEMREPVYASTCEAIARVIKATKIPEGHAEIICAWRELVRKAGRKEDVENFDFGVTEHLLLQKEGSPLGKITVDKYFSLERILRHIESRVLAVKIRNVFFSQFEYNKDWPTVEAFVKQEGKALHTHYFDKKLSLPNLGPVSQKVIIKMLKADGLL